MQRRTQEEQLLTSLLLTQIQNCGQNTYHVSKELAARIRHDATTCGFTTVTGLSMGSAAPAQSLRSPCAAPALSLQRL